MMKADTPPSVMILIRDFMDLIVDAINYEDLARRVVASFAKMFNADLCTLWRRVRENGRDILVLSASIGFERRPGEEVPKYYLNWNAASNGEIEGVTAWIAIRNDTCIANSYAELVKNSATPWYGAHRGKWDNLQFMGNVQKTFTSLMGLPITYGEDRHLIGVVKIENSRKDAGFDQGDFQYARDLLPFVAIALESMTKREQHEQGRQRALKEITTALPVLDLQTFHQQVVDRTAQLLGADICSLWLVSSDRTKLVLGANCGVRDKSEVPEYPLNWTATSDDHIDGLTPWVAIRKQPFFATRFEDLKAHPAHRGRWDRIQWDGSPDALFGVLYAVPLLRADEAIGVLKIENSSDKRVFNDVDRATFDLMADFIALAIEFSSRLQSDTTFEFFHLLKQPTTNAVLAFESLRSEITSRNPRPDRVRERLEMLGRNLETVRTWTKNVYGLASVTGHIADEVPSPRNLHELFTNVIREIQKLFPEFPCRLSEDLKTTSLELTPLQSTKVEVIFYNILDNSFKYSAPGKSITVAQDREPGGTVVTIADEGVGIRADDLTRIFEPRFRSTPDKYPESMGLGLSTVARLLHELGWTREVRSRVGEGTRFSITIPSAGGGR